MPGCWLHPTTITRANSLDPSTMRPGHHSPGTAVAPCAPRGSEARGDHGLAGLCRRNHHLDHVSAQILPKTALDWRTDLTPLGTCLCCCPMAPGDQPIGMG